MNPPASWIRTAAKSTPLLGFLAAGGLATTINFSTFLLGLSFGLSYQAAVVVGYFSGTAVSYAVNRYLVFASSRPALPEVGKFVLVDLVGLGAQLVVLEWFLLLELHVAFANAAAILIVSLFKYFLARRFVFSRRLMSPQPNRPGGQQGGRRD